MELDVSKFQLGGEWLKLKLESKGEDKKTVSLKIKPMSDKESIEIAQLAEKKEMQEFVAKIKDYVLDWDVKSGGKKLECDDKNKKEYLPFICVMILDGEEERVEKEMAENKKKAKEDGVEPKKVFKKGVGMSILEFAQNFDNFIDP